MLIERSMHDVWLSNALCPGRRARRHRGLRRQWRAARAAARVRRARAPDRDAHPAHARAHRPRIGEDELCRAIRRRGDDRLRADRRARHPGLADAGPLRRRRRRSSSATSSASRATRSSATRSAAATPTLVRTSVMDTLMALPHEMRVLPGHTEETTIGREWEHNPFVRYWRGIEPERRRVGARRRRARDARGLVSRLRRQGQGARAVRRRPRGDRRRLAGRAHMRTQARFPARAVSARKPAVVISVSSSGVTP